jgi:hypothetical protein
VTEDEVRYLRAGAAEHTVDRGRGAVEVTAPLGRARWATVHRAPQEPARHGRHGRLCDPVERDERRRVEVDGHDLGGEDVAPVGRPPPGQARPREGCRVPRRMDEEAQPPLHQVGSEREVQSVGVTRLLRPQERGDRVDVVVLVTVLGVQQARLEEDPWVERHRRSCQLAEALLDRDTDQLDVVVAGHDVDAVPVRREPPDGREEGAVAPGDPVECVAGRGIRRIDGPARTGGPRTRLEHVEGVAEHEQLDVRVAVVVEEAGERLGVGDVVVRAEVEVAHHHDVVHTAVRGSGGSGR